MEIFFAQIAPVIIIPLAIIAIIATPFVMFYIVYKKIHKLKSTEEKSKKDL